MKLFYTTGGGKNPDAKSEASHLQTGRLTSQMHARGPLRAQQKAIRTSYFLKKERAFTDI